MLLTHIPDNRFLLIDDAALVCGASMVFSRNLDQGILPIPFDPEAELLEEERAGVLARVVRDGRTHFDFVKPPTMVAHVARDVIPVNLLFPQNYFHFTIEWLPSLNALLREEAAGGAPFIVTGPLHPNISYLLSLVAGGCRIPKMQIEHLQGITCDRVLLPPPSFRCLERLTGGISDATFDREKLSLLRSTLAPLWPASEQRLKLFVRRKGAVRNIINLEEVEARAVAAGYVIFDPGSFLLPDQIRIFREATHIVGPTGAWVANLIYAREDAKIGILYPETVKSETSAWAGLGAIFNQEVADVYCPVPEVLERHPIHSDFYVPPDFVEPLLRR